MDYYTAKTQYLTEARSMSHTDLRAACESLVAPPPVDYAVERAEAERLVRIHDAGYLDRPHLRRPDIVTAEARAVLASALQPGAYPYMLEHAYADARAMLAIGQAVRSPGL